MERFPEVHARLDKGGPSRETRDTPSSGITRGSRIYGAAGAYSSVHRSDGVTLFQDLRRTRLKPQLHELDILRGARWRMGASGKRIMATP
jgi:hypothetical protein